MLVGLVGGGEYNFIIIIIITTVITSALLLLHNFFHYLAIIFYNIFFFPFVITLLLLLHWSTSSVIFFSLFFFFVVLSSSPSSFFFPSYSSRRCCCVVSLLLSSPLLLIIFFLYFCRRSKWRYCSTDTNKHFHLTYTLGAWQPVRTAVRDNKVSMIRALRHFEQCGVLRHTSKPAGAAFFHSTLLLLVGPSNCGSPPGRSWKNWLVDKLFGDRFGRKRNAEWRKRKRWT